MPPLVDALRDFFANTPSRQTPGRSVAGDPALEWAFADEVDAGEGELRWRRVGDLAWSPGEAADAATAIAADVGGEGLVFRVWRRARPGTWARAHVLGFDPSVGFGPLPSPAWPPARGGRWAASRTWPDAWAECGEPVWLVQGGGALVARRSLVAAAVDCVSMQPTLTGRPVVQCAVEEVITAIRSWCAGGLDDEGLLAAGEAFMGHMAPREPISDSAGYAFGHALRAVGYVLCAALAKGTKSGVCPADSVVKDAGHAVSNALDCMAWTCPGGPTGEAWVASAARHKAAMVAHVRRAMPFREVLRGLLVVAAAQSSQ